VAVFVRLFVNAITLEAFVISSLNCYGNKMWSKARTSSKMAAFRLTATTAVGIFTISTQFGIGRVCGACDWLLAHYEY